MNQETMAHNIATAYASSETAKEVFNSPQEKLERFVEEYCVAYGFVMSRNPDWLEELIRRGE